MNPIKSLMMKGIFPMYYKMCAKKPVRDKALFLEVRYPRITDNLALLRRSYDEDPEWEISDFFLETGSIGGKAYFSRCLALIRALADARLVFIDESSNILSALPLRKETKVIQTWHACGAFKRWGCGLGGDAALSAREYYSEYDLVTVSAEEVRDKYAESMAQNIDVVKPLGVSRTDRLFGENFRSKALRKVREAFPDLEGRKLILYAPTFRGNVARAEGPELPDLNKLYEEFGGECMIIYRGHPAVKTPPAIPEEIREKNFFGIAPEEISTDELMVAADICITDYSSIIFEYSLLGRPMIFYTYDLDKYDGDRGFYYPLKEFVPGPICQDTEELGEALKAGLADDWDDFKVLAFRDKFMGACDGQATARIVRYIEKELLT